MSENDDQQQSHQGSSYSELVHSVHELITMMSEGGICELDLSQGDMSVRLRTAAANAVTYDPSMMAMRVAQPMAMPVAAASATDASAEPAARPGHAVTSPMIGTYYSAPAPGEPAFVQVGDDVEAGQVIGIIEAMKIMNEITADRSGVVLELLVENAQPVEYGTPLLRIGAPGSLS